jgi:hypothetical protein
MIGFTAWSCAALVAHFQMLTSACLRPAGTASAMARVRTECVDCDAGIDKKMKRRASSQKCRKSSFEGILLPWRLRQQITFGVLGERLQSLAKTAQATWASNPTQRTRGRELWSLGGPGLLFWLILIAGVAPASVARHWDWKCVLLPNLERCQPTNRISVHRPSSISRGS